MKTSAGGLITCVIFCTALTVSNGHARGEEVKMLPPAGGAVPAASDKSQGKQDAQRADVLLYADFEKDNSGFVGGERVTDVTFSNSKGAFKATPDLADLWNSCKIMTDVAKQGKPGAKGLFQVGPQTKLTFAYYLEDNDWLFVSFWSGERQMTLQVPVRTEKGKWSIVQINFWEYNANIPEAQRFKDGNWIDMLSFITGAAKTSPKFVLDNIIVNNGEVPTDIGRTIAERLAEAKLLNSDPKKDGYYITELILENLKKICRKDDAVPSSIGLLGDDLANSPLLVRPLMAKELKGRTLLTAQSYSGDQIDLKAVFAKIGRGAKRNKPEVMLVMAGYNDITILNTSPENVVAGIREIVKKLIELGVCPVLVNFARPMGVSDSFSSKFGDVNRALMAMAIELQVPLIDMYSVIGNREKPNTYFAPTGKFNKQGYEVLNNLFYRVYRLIECKVLDRTGPLVTLEPKDESKEPPKPEPDKPTPDQKAKDKIDKQIKDVEI
jgi:lysophospholipase L1-like esterase